MKPYRALKKRVWDIVSVANEGDNVSRIFDITIFVAIVISISALILQTVESMYSAAPPVFWWIERISLGIFVIEYILRLWSSSENSAHQKRKFRRIRFIFSPLALIDLIAILPSLLPFFGFHLVYIRAIWLFRLVRIAKLGRYSVTLHTFQRIIKNKREELITSMAFLFILLIVSSSFMYFAEHTAQPDNFKSIPETMWWAIITVTTIGYGDVFPVTILGKFITFVTALLGIGIAAMSTGVVTSAFTEEIQKKQQQTMLKKTHTCPTCGHHVKEKRKKSK